MSTSTGRKFWCLWLLVESMCPLLEVKNAIFDLWASVDLQSEVLFPEFWFVSFQERLSLWQEKLNQFEDWNKGTFCLYYILIHFLFIINVQCWYPVTTSTKLQHHFVLLLDWIHKQQQGSLDTHFRIWHLVHIWHLSFWDSWLLWHVHDISFLLFQIRRGACKKSVEEKEEAGLGRRESLSFRRKINLSVLLQKSSLQRLLWNLLGIVMAGSRVLLDSFLMKMKTRSVCWFC